MNYTTQKGVPTAHITKRKSRLKLYNGNNVFLNDGDNFEFELHNPKNKSVLAKIKLNGEYISSGGIVIRPGQRVFLERFLDSNNKFVFSTYSVKDNDENNSAIALNGDIRIEFYDEEYPFTTYTNNLIFRGGSNLAWGTLNTGSPLMGGNITYTNSNTSSIPIASYSNQSIETGRIEKGNSSNQNFSNSFENFSYSVSKYYDFKILPLSQKNKGIEDIRYYCTECGFKVRMTFKFCPSCGNKL